MMNTGVKVIKSGWLKKQGGLVRNWQDRWFVLKGQNLYYYTKEDEAKQQGSISLYGCKIIELPFNRDEPERWLLEIGQGDRTGKSNESQFLCVNCETERTAWSGALRRAIYGCIGGGVFGGPLVDVTFYDKAHHNCDVPHIIKHCVELILEHGKEVEGIFRLNGRLALVKEMRKRYDEGQRPNLTLEIIDIHTTASLLKLYFRELPEPVIPFEHFESFLDLATSFKHNSNPERTLQNLKSLTKQIPEENYKLLDYLTSFLNEISKYQHVNKMTERNIATIFGTNILRERDSTPEVQLATQNLTTHVVLALVKWHDLIFSDSVAIGDSVRVSVVEFAKIVSLSEEPGDMSETNNAQTDSQSTGVADLLGVNFANEVFSHDKRHTSPPPIPTRRSEYNGSKDSGLDLYSISTPDINQTPDSTTSLDALTSSTVQRRAVSVKNKSRPAAIVQAQHSPVDQPPVREKRKSNSLPIIKVLREPSNFTSFIDSPLDSRMSLNIGDLPSSVDDLQALVLSLKIQLKEQNKAMGHLGESNKALETRLRQQLVELHNERQTKDDAVARVVALSQQLAVYKSQFG